jgi:ABC-type glycerol-3-phosphate transport system substrate-binding protein
MKPFNAFLIIVFALLAFVALFIIATFSGNTTQAVGSVTIWGPLSEGVMNPVIQEVQVSSNELRDTEYVFVPEDELIPQLVEAIATGTGPDMVLFPASAFIAHQDKLIPIPYRTISRRTFQDTFIESGEVFLRDEGVFGIPFYIDPYVLYWNRTLFSEAGVARAPRYWDEVADIAPRLSKKTEAGTLLQSAIALGEWDNVRGAKDILVSLITGLGGSVVDDASNGALVATLSRRGSGNVLASESALRFYTEFADPNQTVFSWNRAQPDNRDAFVGGLLAMYLGRASELRSIRESNPNLNFDIAPYPYARDGSVTVPAHVYALAIPRGSRNPNGAVLVAQILSASGAQNTLKTETGLPSVRRDELALAPDNPYESIFRDAALNGHIFKDPDAEETDRILKRMVESVTSGRARLSEAIFNAQSELERVVNRVQ